HCGISNAALINQGDPLAVKYQKVSPLEQHSIDRALEVLNDESHRTALLQAVIQPNNNDAPVTNNEHNAAKSRVVEIFRNCILAMNISRTVDHEAILTVTSCSNAVPCNSSFNISKCNVASTNTYSAWATDPFAQIVGEMTRALVAPLISATTKGSSSDSESESY
ncbi:unnamed protein product, partial [Didymodactylos carnosus]